jgi:hypothetical protein
MRPAPDPDRQIETLHAWARRSERLGHGGLVLVLAAALLGTDSPGFDLAASAGAAAVLLGYVGQGAFKRRAHQLALDLGAEPCLVSEREALPGAPAARDSTAGTESV